MTAAPKPRAYERELTNAARKRDLWAWRRIEYEKVYIRSGGICEIQKKCKGRAVDDIHHVYGRGKDMYDWREDHKSMLATCRQCHPPPIKHKPAGPKLAWVEEILERINA